MNADNQWTVYRTRFLVRARQLTEPVAFTDALGREQSGHSGDYLVEFSDGIKRITNQALFEDVYVPLEGPRSMPAQHQSMEKKLSVRGVPGALAQSVPPGSIEGRNRASA